MPAENAHQCLIVGGGLAGLMAARKLHDAGIGITVLDKGRGLGGRLATRRFSHPEAGEGVFDYGAQYFIAVPVPGGLWGDGAPIRWMADNQQKGISPQAVAVTIHAGAEFSNIHWDSSDELIVAKLLKAAAPWVKSPVLRCQVHRWRYSQPLPGSMPEFFQPVKAPAPLMLAGDGFGGGRVEGAARSGLAAAAALLEMV